MRPHRQPGPSLASETPCGSPAATTAPAINTAATIIEGNRRLFKVGFMTGFQLDCENLDDHLLAADVVPGSEWCETRAMEKKAGGRYAADLFLRLPGWL